MGQPIHRHRHSKKGFEWNAERIKKLEDMTREGKVKQDIADYFGLKTWQIDAAYRVYTVGIKEIRKGL